MNGCVIANTPIAVDFWKVRQCPHARLFFLTHLHGDHITGLTPSWHHPIYCSEITGRLLKHKFELKEDLIKVLEIGSPCIVYLDRECSEQMTVTAIDANHCPGAVMFLFEGYFGRILHTGDFRFTPQMLQSPPLSRVLGKVDILYLDNTYCSPKCLFPERDSVTESMVKIIQSHPNHDIVIGMRNLGKEDLLCKIAVEFETWISVPDSNFKTLQILEVQDVFKSNNSECRVRVVPFHKISNRFVDRLNEEAPTIVILPTALYVGIDAQPYVNQENVFVVPYSDHSSYTELKTFVSAVKPCTIIPIVKSKSRGPFGLSIADRSDMSCFQSCLNDECKREFCVPQSVKSFMNNYRSNPVIIGKPLKQKTLPKKSKNNRHKQRGITYQSPDKNQPLIIKDRLNKESTAQCEKVKSVNSDLPELINAVKKGTHFDEKGLYDNDVTEDGSDKVLTFRKSEKKLLHVKKGEDNFKISRGCKRQLYDSEDDDDCCDSAQFKRNKIMCPNNSVIFISGSQGFELSELNTETMDDQDHITFDDDILSEFNKECVNDSNYKAVILSISHSDETLGKVKDFDSSSKSSTYLDILLPQPDNDKRYAMTHDQSSKQMLEQRKYVCLHNSEQVENVNSSTQSMSDLDCVILSDSCEDVIYESTQQSEGCQIVEDVIDESTQQSEGCQIVEDVIYESTQQSEGCQIDEDVIYESTQQSEGCQIDEDVIDVSTQQSEGCTIDAETVKFSSESEDEKEETEFLTCNRNDKTYDVRMIDVLFNESRQESTATASEQDPKVEDDLKNEDKLDTNVLKESAFQISNCKCNSRSSIETDVILSILDIKNFNLFPISAQQKRVRRRKMFRNLTNGIKKFG